MSGKFNEFKEIVASTTKESADKLISQLEDLGVTYPSTLKSTLEGNNTDLSTNNRTVIGMDWGHEPAVTKLTVTPGPVYELGNAEPTPLYKLLKVEGRTKSEPALPISEIVKKLSESATNRLDVDRLEILTAGKSNAIPVEQAQEMVDQWLYREKKVSDLKIIKGNPQTDQYLLIKDRGEYLVVLNDYLVGKTEIVFTLGHIDSELPMQDLLFQAEQTVTLLNKGAN